MDIVQVENEKYVYKLGQDGVKTISYFPSEYYKYGESWMTEPASARINFEDGTYIILYDLIQIIYKVVRDAA